MATDLGINQKTLYGWVRQYTKHKDNAFPGSGRLRPEDYKIRMLERRIADLKEENAILKKGEGFLRKPPELKFQFIKNHRFEFRVGKMCQVVRTG